MSESNNQRWQQHLAPFDVAPQAPQKPTAAVEDRSWMPQPSIPPNGLSGHDWWKNGQWKTAWQQPRDFAAKHHPAFSQQLEALETELSGLERTLPSHHPRIAPVRQQLSRYYAQLNRIHDNWIKQQPLIRY